MSPSPMVVIGEEEGGGVYRALQRYTVSLRASGGAGGGGDGGGGGGGGGAMSDTTLDRG